MNDEGQPNQQKTISWTEPFFFGSSIVSFVVAIIACFVPQLLVTRPFFFGLLLSLLTHKLLGGVGTGEITGFKSALGNIKITGPIAVLLGSMGAIYVGINHFEDKRILELDPKKNEIVIFREKEGKKVTVKVTRDSQKLYEIEETQQYSSLFDFFIKKCLVNKVEGCTIQVKVVVNDQMAKKGKAFVCGTGFRGIKFILNSEVEPSSLKNLGVPVTTTFKNCSYPENTIIVSKIDAEEAGIKLKENQGTGFISPFLGDVIEIP